MYEQRAGNTQECKARWDKKVLQAVANWNCWHQNPKACKFKNTLKTTKIDMSGSGQITYGWPIPSSQSFTSKFQSSSSQQMVSCPIPTRGHLSTSEDIQGGNGVEARYWAETREVAQHPATHRMNPCNNYLALSVAGWGGDWNWHIHTIIYKTDS